DKTKGKARKRVKLPQKIQDYMTNLTVDLKEAQINLGKMETVKMNLWQSFDSLKQIVRILRNKNLIGKFEDWRDLMCEDCKYKKKLMEDVIELELEGTIKGEKEEKEITFSYIDWEYFLDKVKEKPPKKEEPKKLPKDYKPIKEINIKRKPAKKGRRKRCKNCKELYSKEDKHECVR
ncbi:hypothetical protein LCGC14_2615790, partial [marine sediment metagenome]